MNTTPQPQNQPQAATVIQHPAVVPSNDSWISRFSSTTVTIKFGKFWDLTNSGNWAAYLKRKGIYVVYMVPDHMADKLDTLPVINEYAIYVGESSSDLYKRFRAFKLTLDEMMDQSLRGITGTTTTITPGNRQSAAIQFFNAVIKKHVVSYRSNSKEFVCVKDHKLMVRVAEKAPNWIRKTSDHESVLLSEVNEAHPGKLYNKR